MMQDRERQFEDKQVNIEVGSAVEAIREWVGHLFDWNYEEYSWSVDFFSNYLETVHKLMWMLDSMDS